MESNPQTQISRSDAPPPAGTSTLPDDNDPQPSVKLAGDAKPAMEEEKASLAAAVLACNEALDKLRLGKRNEAVEIIGSAYRKFPTSGMVRRCTALILLVEASDHRTYNQGYRWSFRQAAILYATGAADPSPDELIYEDPEKKERLNVVIKICEVAQSMENSVFCGIELLDKDNNGVIQAEFDKIRQDLEKLIRMCTDITVTDWLKFLPTVQEREEPIKSDETKSRWTGWICHSCADSDERFDNLKSLKQHTVLRHVGKLPPDSCSKLPKDVSGEWIELFVGVDDSLPSSSKNVSAAGSSSFLAMDESVFKQISAFVHDAVRGPDETLEGFHDQPLELRTEEKAQQVLSLMESIVKHFNAVGGYLDRKSWYFRQKEELHKREEYMKYRIMLRNRMDQLEGEEVLDVKQQYEMEAISNILVDGEPAVVDRYGINATCTEREINECLGIAIQIQKEQIEHEMKKIDSALMTRVGRMMELMEKVGAASVVDYGANLKSLMNYYTQIGEAGAEKYGDEMVEGNAENEGSAMQC